jgi:uncharacterized membrane protein
LSVAPPELEQEETQDSSPPLNRMLIAVLSLIGFFISGYLMLHRLGYMGTLACGTGACETVQTSPWATFVGIPVPLIGVIGYVVLFACAFIGLQPARLNDRNISLSLVALSGGALLFSGYLTAIEAFRIHAWCRYCLGSQAIILLIFLLSLPEIGRVRAARTSLTST